MPLTLHDRKIDPHPMKTTPATLPPDVASAVVCGFLSKAYSRSAVRLNAADYGFRRGATPAEFAAAREAYLSDRNQIRRATRDLHKAERDVAHIVNEPSRHVAFAAALIEACRLSRWEYVGGDRGYNAYGYVWHYTAGQYQPTEIRWQAADVLRRAYRIYLNS